MLSIESLPYRLSEKLHIHSKLRVYHISTPPETSSGLFAPGPGQAEPPTSCESHFLGVTQSSDDLHHEFLVVGVEVLVFTTNSLTTVFVSKADSTGLLSRRPSGHIRQSVAQVVITTFLSHIILPRLAIGSRLVLSLFARSQNQYLFPGSIENSTKHVLDDRQLIKWWCRVLDPFVHPIPNPNNVMVTDHNVRGYLIVPGCDRGETKAFFPRHALSLPINESWLNRYPIEILGDSASLPPRCVIPRFPDDPKARFLEDLDSEHIDESGNWRSVKTLDQFWEMMSYRQECSAGRLVGFIWIVFPGQPKNEPSTMEQTSNEPLENDLDTVKVIQTPQSSTCAASSDDKTSEGAVHTHQEGGAEVNGAANNFDLDDSSRQAESSGTATTTFATDQKVTPTTGYQELMDHLLQLDFAGIDLAVQSTRSWIEKAKSLGLLENTGVEVVGRLQPATDIVASKLQPREINVLNVVRKKRKATLVGHTDQTDGVADQADVKVKSLDTGLIRKKPKA